MDQDHDEQTWDGLFASLVANTVRKCSHLSQEVQLQKLKIRYGLIKLNAEVDETLSKTEHASQQLLSSLDLWCTFSDDSRQILMDEFVTMARDTFLPVLDRKSVGHMKRRCENIPAEATGQHRAEINAVQIHTMKQTLE